MELHLSLPTGECKAVPPGEGIKITEQGKWRGHVHGEPTTTGWIGHGQVGVAYPKLRKILIG